MFLEIQRQYHNIVKREVEKSSIKITFKKKIQIRLSSENNVSLREETEI